MLLQNNRLLEIRNAAFTSLVVIYLAAIHVSPSIASIASILLIVNSVWFFFETKKSKQLLIIQALFLSVFLVCIALSISHGCQLNELMAKILVRLPLVFLPSLVSYVQLNKLSFSKYWLFFSLPIFWLSVASVFNYIDHFAFLSQMILESKPIPIYSGVYHIEFSVITAMVLLVLLSWKIEGKISKIFGSHFFFYFVFGGLFIALHVLSARTGLLGFWSGICAIIFQRGKKISFKYILMGLVALSSMFFIPSIKNRLMNTYEDLNAVTQNKDLNHKSFGQRWEAWKAIIHAGQETTWFGVGQCNIERKMQQSFDELKSNLDAENRISPHNQYLQWFIEIGIVGMLMWITCFSVFFIWMRRNGVSEQLWSVVIALILSINFESLMERQSGVMIIIVSLLLISGMKLEKTLN
jgi:O-antigen ligase